MDQGRARLLALCLLWGLCVGCASPFGAGAPATPTVPATRTIRVGFSSALDMGDLPSVMAQALLADSGITVEPLFFSSVELETVALAQGDVDIANGSNRTQWTAVAEGAQTLTIMEQVGNVWLLIAEAEIETCEALDGRAFALTSTGSLTSALTDAYLQSTCPEVEPELVFISGSENRAAALLSGDIAATPLELADWLRIESQAPGRFHVLANFAEVVPDVVVTGVHVNRDFAAQHPDRVRAYLRALLTIHRQLAAEPQGLAQAAVEHLSLSEEQAQRNAAAYLALDLWDSNGGMERDAIQKSLDFFIGIESVPEGLGPDDVADFSFLNQVLDEMGRQ